jgi:hypothetical protein
MDTSSGLLDQREQPGHRVADVAEAAGLRAVAVDGQRLAAQCLVGEPRQHHAVPPGLTRAGHVEQPADDRPHATLPPVRRGHRLVHRLRLGVRPAVRQG